MSGGSSSGFGLGVGVAGGPTLAATQQGQGVAALVVMFAVLCFIFAYCCWGAPFCRSLCRRHCCCQLENEEPDSRFGSTDQALVATPTIILLPHGRMLVVDGTIFTQFQADTTGLDLVELGENVLRAQRNPRCLNRHQLQSSQGSVLEMDAETPSKDSMGSIGCFPPPTYDSIYGKDEGEMPPSYSDILLHRFTNLPYDIELQDHCCNSKEDIEMHSLENCPHIITNPINRMTYHPYSTVTSFSSQSFPRRNASRNSSLASNLADDFYIDNELGGIYTISNVNVPMTEPQSRISTQELRSNLDNSLYQLSISVPEYSLERRPEHSQSRHELSENSDRLQSEESQNDNEGHENVEFQNSLGCHGETIPSNDDISDDLGGQTSRQALRTDRIPIENDNDEENNDFCALADIRESRV